MNLKLSLHSLCVAVLVFSGITSTAQVNAVRSTAAQSPAKVAPNYGKLPLSFEPNYGQADSSIKFLARGVHYNVLLQPDAATLVLNREEASREHLRMHAQAVSATRAAVRMTLEGANPRAAMSSEQMLPGYVNYISSDKSRTQTGIPTYAVARSSGVYPGIDVLYYGKERELEYDFVVSPQSDPSLIHLLIVGAQPVVEPNGELRLKIVDGKRDEDIVFRKPILYQRIGGRRKAVEGSFTVAKDDEISFRVGSYDHSRELIIDPVISYGSYFGGSGEDEINGSGLNAANQLYAVGETYSTYLPGSTGEFQVNPAGGNNGHEAFVTKFSADGTSVLWTTYLGGASDDIANAVAVNAADQPYIVGYTNSCPAGQTNNQSVGEFPFTANAVQQLCNPNGNSYNTVEVNSGGNATSVGYDAFLVQLSADGKTELYGTPLGGSNDDFANGVAVDAAGKVYIVGQTYSTGYFFAVSSNLRDVPSYPVNNHQVPSIGQANFPTTKTAYYTNITESVKYSTTDSSGNIGGPSDEQAFVTVLSPNMQTILYSSLIGGGIIGGCGNGACNTNGIAIAVNAAGQVFIGGNTSSAHWPTTTGAFAATCSNAGAANSQCPMTGWLAGFDPSQSGAASLLFSTYMNGSSAGKDGNGNPIFPGSDVFGLAVDSKGNIVATGDTNADNFPTTAGTLQPACVQFGDGNGNSLRCQSAYVTKLSPTGATVWSTHFGPTSQPGNGVTGQGVALDANDNVFVVGTSTSPTLPLVHPISTNPAQNNDAFVIELSPTGASELMGTFIGSTAGLSLNNNALHLDSSLNAYISGSQAPNTYGGTTFPTTTGAFSQTIQGSDGWVLKLITQQQTSNVALQITPNAAAPGTSISFAATVTGLPTFAIPTGTVTLSSGSTTIGTITLTNGTGTFSTTSLAAGTYSVIATYSGDVVYATSVSAAQKVAIQNTPTVALTATPLTASLGTAVTLKATVISSAGTPTGTVYFMDGTVTLGSGVLSGGVATYSAAALGVGTHSITANYSGDGSFSALTSSAQTVTITATPPSITAAFNPATLTIKQGATGSTTLTVTPANGFAGTLNFSCGSLPSSASCGFSPTSLTFSSASSAAQSSTLTVSTNASIIGALHPTSLGQHGGREPVILTALLLLPLGFTRSGRRMLCRHSTLSMVLCAAVLIGLGALSGCSGTSTPPAAATTPVGSYTIGVTVAGAPAGTAALNLQINVQ